MSAYADVAVERDVLSAAEGDRDAFVRLVERHSSVVNSIALSIVRNLPASEDVTQDVFLVAWRDVRKLRNPSSFLPWLRQIARNRANEWLRENRLRITDKDADSILAATVDHRLTAPEILERDEQQRIVDEVIDSLPDESREVIALFYKEGRSVRQVADLLSLSEEAVKKRLSRARQRIREELLERFGEVVRRTAPGAVMAAAVAASLTVAGPAAAAAATSAATAKAGGASLLVKVAATAGGSLLGALLGGLGLWLGTRKSLAAAADDQERRELKRYYVVATVVLVLASAGYGVAGVLKSASVLVVTHVLFVGILGTMCMVWQPRISARRNAAMLAADPAAAKRLARQRAVSWIALAIGVTISTATVVWVMFQSGMV